MGVTRERSRLLEELLECDAFGAVSCVVARMEAENAEYSRLGSIVGVGAVFWAVPFRVDVVVGGSAYSTYC